jgi:imidazolonepropionase-like amidohydrolase
VFATSIDRRSPWGAVAVVTLAAAFIAWPSSTPPAAGNGGGTLVVRGGTLVDGTGGEPLADATLVVRDGRVTEVATRGAASLGAAEGIDARGKWIVPGLIDMHVHYHPGWMDPLFLRHGVTTVRDVGSRLDTILALRDENRTPGVARPRLFACGPLIDGPSPRHGTGISVSVQTVPEARAAARRLLDRGVDCLKIYEQLTPPLVEAIVREAEGTRVPVTAHLRDTTALQALEIGVRGLEHALGFEACDETVAAQVVSRVVERGAYVVPTLAITEQISRLGSPGQETMALLGEIPPARREYWRARAAAASPDRTAGAARRLGCLKAFLARLQRAGGQVVAGSDTSNPYVIPGASLHRELELLVEAGLSPREALAAATRTAAAVLGQAPTLGTLEVGKTADLVLLGADPVASITAIRQVEIVIRDGRVVWRR